MSAHRLARPRKSIPNVPWISSTGLRYDLPFGLELALHGRRTWSSAHAIARGVGIPAIALATMSGTMKFTSMSRLTALGLAGQLRAWPYSASWGSIANFGFLRPDGVIGEVLAAADG